MLKKIAQALESTPSLDTILDLLLRSQESFWLYKKFINKDDFGGKIR